jgi:hypothetical protein
MEGTGAWLNNNAAHDQQTTIVKGGKNEKSS